MQDNHRLAAVLRSARDAPHLSHAAFLFVVPMVHGENAHRRVDAGIMQWQRTGAGADRRDAVGAAPRDHHRRVLA